MMKKVLFALSCLVAISFTGCDKPAGGEETGSGITVTGGTTIEAEANQTTATLAITAEAAWTASIESGAEWLLEVTPANGEAGNHTLTLNFTANETETARTATVRLASGDDAVTVTLNQKGTNDEGGEQPAGDAIVKEMTLTEHSYMVFTTDAERRVTRCEFRVTDMSSASIDEFAFGENQLVWTSYSSDEADKKTVYNCVMENGRVVTINEPDGDRITYTYNADGTLASSVYVDAQGQETGGYTYTWTDGNLTRIAEESITWTIEYGEQQSGVANIDPMIYILGELDDELLGYRLLGTVSRNLPTSCKVQFSDSEDDISLASYSYQFGENGAVSKMQVMVDGIEAAVRKLKY